MVSIRAPRGLLFPNPFLGLDFFCRFLQQTGFSFKKHHLHIDQELVKCSSLLKMLGLAPMIKTHNIIYASCVSKTNKQSHSQCKMVIAPLGPHVPFKYIPTLHSRIFSQLIDTLGLCKLLNYVGNIHCYVSSMQPVWEYFFRMKHWM